jgi:ribonucleotide reductase alpha subunit
MSQQEHSADEITVPVKRTDGETLEERMTDNAYHNILPARYLRKDADGNPAETQDDLFARVAENVALAEAVFESEQRDTEVTVQPDQLKPNHPRRDELAADVFGAGTTADDDAETDLSIYNVNKFAYETVVPELPDDIREHVEGVADEFQESMERLSFMPNSPTLMNAGDELQQLSACFVNSPDDDLEDIHQTANEAAMTFQSGGGMGYAFWQLRPYGDPVGSTGGIASGPITFMRTYDQLCETIAQGGTRRGAQMGVMRVSHPDVIEFIHSKNKDVSLAHTLRLNDPDDYTYTSFSEALEEARGLIDEEGRVPKHLRNAVEGHLSNFNISVGVTDGFMEALYEDEEFTFTNPRTGEPHVATAETKEMYARYGLGEYVEPGEELSLPAEIIWDRVVQGAHENGEPGVIYLERVNKEHSFDVDEYPDHRILATNPCVTGETVIRLADGTERTVKELAADGDAVEVLCRDTETNGTVVKQGQEPRKTRSNAEVIRVQTEAGASLVCTPDHEIWTPAGYTPANELGAGDEIIGATSVETGTHLTETLTVAYTESAGEADVYNITVDDHHNYLCRTEGDEGYLSVANCGEQPLEEYEACNLGHINLSTIAAFDAPDWRVWSAEHADEHDSQEAAVETYLEEAIDFDEFDRRIELGTRFLEDVVTMSDFPVREIEEKVRELRKIGLGIMGLAQLYVQIGVRYGSDVGNEVARQLMTHINHQSKQTSHELALERGSFDDWEDSKYANPTEYREWFEHHTGQSADDWEDGFPIRNHNSTTIAPTGTTSMVGNTTGGCEPIYNVAYYKNVSDDVQGDEMLVEFDDYFLRVLEANDIDPESVKVEAQEQMANNAFDGVSSLSSVPEAISELFVVTADITAKEHAAVQCACQAGVDSAISKTVNAPNDSTMEDAKDVFEYIYDHGGKGVTYYRDGTRSKQVLTTRADNAEFADEREAATAITEQIREVFGDIEDFLGSEEVKDELDEDIEELFTDRTGDAYARERPRPDVLYGMTQRVDTGYGKMYVNINEDEDGEPFELFATIGNSGGFTASFTEGLAKTISYALRSGVDPREIAKDLQGIRSPKVAWDKGEQINSIPDAIGVAMRRYLDDEIDRPYPQQQHLTEITEIEEDPQSKSSSGTQSQSDPATDAGPNADVGPETDGGGTTADTQSLIDAGESPECPECGSMALYFSEGCKTCESCGWSEC